MAPRKNTNSKKVTSKLTTTGKSKIVKRSSKSVNSKVEAPLKKIAVKQSKATKDQLLHHEQKVALANEVVRYQLKPNKLSITINSNKIIPAEDVKSKKAKPKKCSISTSIQVPNETGGKSAEKPKKKASKKTTSNMVTRKTVTRKRSADSTQKNVKCPAVRQDKVEPKRRRININSTLARKDLPNEGKVKHRVKEEIKNNVSPSIGQVNGPKHRISRCPGLIGLRQISVSSNSCMSWTKDLSSSSRCSSSLAATSCDFVRIDKKLPIIKLTNINCESPNRVEKKTNNADVLMIDSDSSDESNSETSVHTCDSKSLNTNLSTSTLWSVSNIEAADTCENTAKDELSKAFDKLTLNLKYFDTEIMGWIGYNKGSASVDIKKFSSSIMNTFREECEVINNCRKLRKILCSDDDSESCEKDSDFVVEESHFDEIDVVSRDAPDCGINDRINPNENVERNTTIDTVYNENGHAQSQTNESCDDDDAISIYAESLTGIESEKVSAPILPLSKQQTEIVPEPTKTDSDLKIFTCYPKKINKNNELVVKKTVCEKQNADSTSVLKENHELAIKRTLGSVSNEFAKYAINDNSPKLAEGTEATAITEPVIIDSISKPQHQNCSILKNVCQFNLNNHCQKNSNCRFSHLVPDVSEVRSKLKALSDEAFVAEYVSLRKVYNICRKYGICFIEECSNRDMPRLIIEMSMNFLMNVKNKSKDDSVCRKEILECALLKLNTVNLNICEDILLQPVTPMMLLCDVFMETIAESQNFLRFRLVFLNLTLFIVKHTGVFSFLVAEQILERVCILPPEKPLSRALVDIIKHTDTAIFNNNMLGQFESILLSLDRNLHSDLLSAKTGAMDSLMASPSESNRSSHCSNSMESFVPVNSFIKRGDRSYVSPDTTDNINMHNNRFSSGVSLSRKMDFNHSHFNGPKQKTWLNSNPPIWEMNENIKTMQRDLPQASLPSLFTIPVTRPMMGLSKNKRKVAYRPMATTRYQWRPSRNF